MADANNTTAPQGALRRCWSALRRPSVRYASGTLFVMGGVAGILFWGGFNWAMEASNSEAFCISCHEMRNTVYRELQETVHFGNASGVRATCADCHVPREWAYKVRRKVAATNELFHKVAGTIDTPEKFEAHRLELAQKVWTQMKATDSRECRNCHAADSMVPAAQNRLAQRRHKAGAAAGQTCIECHQGIAHELPAGWDAP
jgi:cytochrome c-type protein NapC